MAQPVMMRAPEADPSGGYQPRDVVNAPQIKAAIEARSAARGDASEVHQWLRSHFFRWVVGSFDHAIALHGPADYQRAAGAQAELPPWLRKRWLRGSPAQTTDAAAPVPPCYHIDPEHPLLVDRERVLVEFLQSRAGTRHAGKLNRISCFTALALWEEEHRRMQTRRNRGWVPSSGLALRECLRTPNGIIFEFDGQHAALREEMAYESFHMQHCLGQFARMDKLRGGYGEHYAKAVQAGALRLFTLRSASNQPHVTLSLRLQDGSLRIDQIKGKQNRDPIRRYADDVLAFRRALALPGERHADCEGMGIVHEVASEAEGADAVPETDRAGWKFITDVRDTGFLLSAMTANLYLIEHFERPPAALQWLLLRVAPELLDRVRHIEPAVAAAARLTLPPESWPPALRTLTPVGDAPQPFWIEGQPIDPALCAPVHSGAKG